MDSKKQGLTVMLAVCIVAFIGVMVLYVNAPKEHGEDGVSGNQAGAETVYDTIGPNLSQEQLHAFLRDETFFDDAVSVNVAEFVGEELPRLYLQATSVYKDIRVTVTDIDGVPVTGESFYIDVEGKGEYKDLDKDGIITIPELTAGEYYVSLKSVMGYVVPTDPMPVTVKDILEYKVIDDIDFYIYSEDEIDKQQDDTEVVYALEDADDTEITTINRTENATFGIDVSGYQGDIDWERVKAAGVEFAIIRVGYRGSVTGKLVEDSYFRQNLEGARRAGVQVGLYFFTQATSEIEAVEEASMVISLLDGSDIDYPIFIDTEGAGGNGRADLLDIETRTAVCKAFCKTVESAGYHGGVYASRNWYYRYLNAAELEEFVIWDAEYVGTAQYTGKYDMWQYTSSGMIDGINTRVDLDLSYIEIN